MTRGTSEAKALRFFVLLALITVVLDQLSKAWIRATLQPGETLSVVEGWLHFSHVWNRGAAWGLLSGRRWLLVLVAFVVIAFVLSAARDVAARGKVASAALGLILGGAIGNLIDRIRQGYVTDFIDLDTPVDFLRTFPVWNIADAALTVGAVLMALVFFSHKGTKTQKEQV